MKGEDLDHHDDIRMSRQRRAHPAEHAALEPLHVDLDEAEGTGRQLGQRRVQGPTRRLRSTV
jgi:hypothetical protein